MTKNNRIGIVYFGAVDEHDQPVKRPKSEYPYSYDGFVVWRGGANRETTGTIYSDRLLQWDYEKYNRLAQKYFGNQGQMFFDRSPKAIEAFLQEWCDEPCLKLILVMEYCNVSNGFPLWRFDYATPKAGL